MLKIVIGIFLLLLMIIIHEFGHFIAGKLLKVPVYEFAIGMGPKIFEKKGNKETTYTIRCIPVGGFCSFDKGDATGIQDLELNKYPIWKRILIFSAGATFNIVSAFLIAIFISGVIGLPTPTTNIVSIADERADSFLQAGDTITSINSINVENNFSLMSQEIAKTEDGTINITVRRANEEKTSDIKLIDMNGSWMLGVSIAKTNVKSIGLINILRDSFTYCWDTGASVLLSLKGLITREVKLNQMSGVVGIVDAVGQAAHENLLNVLHYFILLSINLGIFNLLPIPVLDGSKIIFCVYEAIFKKRVPEKVEEYLTLGFAAALIVLMVYVTAHDIIRLF